MTVTVKIAFFSSRAVKNARKIPTSGWILKMRLRPFKADVSTCIYSNFEEISRIVGLENHCQRQQNLSKKAPEVELTAAKYH